ncbi:replication initiator [Actinocorallia lasiicapitis]
MNLTLTPLAGPAGLIASLISPAVARQITERTSRPDYGRWAARTKALGGCAQPVHLTGRADHVHAATGEVVGLFSSEGEPDGLVRVACKTRRASRCPACAEVYRADTYQLIRAGMVGGKGVPATVIAHPAAFVTLTAPSFGPVHTQRTGRAGACHPRRGAQPCPHGRVPSCTARHQPGDDRLGTPLCPDCYDYTGQVLFNALAPELWRRFTLALRRRLADVAGVPVSVLRDVVTVSFAKVAEFQKRGVVHLHAVIRLDGPDGPADTPPTWATPAVLEAAVRSAVPAVTVSSPASPGMPARAFGWGRQVDVRLIKSGGKLTDQAVAGYVAKYATKAAESVGTLDRRLRESDLPILDHLVLSDHARTLIVECVRLGSFPELEGLRLRAWAHMLGFRGHFSTKSRRYSTTLGALRQARIDHARAQHADATGPEAGEILVVGEWEFVGQGLTAADAVLTAALTGKPLPDIVVRPMRLRDKPVMVGGAR